MAEQPRGRTRKVLGLLALVVVLGVGIERLIVTDEEAVSATVDRLIEAVEQEDRATLDALLLPEFEYSGPRPIERGDRARAFEQLGEFWREADGIGYTRKPREVRLAGPTAAHISSGVVRFEWGDLVAVQRMTFEVTCVKRGEDWQVAAVQVTDLRRGLF